MYNPTNMTLKKIAWKPLLLSCCVLLASGCSDSFLDERNPQSVGFDHIKDTESLTAATIGVYSNFNATNYYGRTFIVTPEVIGDNTFISFRNGGRYLNHDRFAITNGDGYVTGAWTAMYRVVANANLALAAARAIDWPANQQQEANQLMGELLACRALAYFDLQRFFAQPYNYTADATHPGVPLITEPSSDILAPARSSTAEVYQQIVADLLEAEQLMQPQVKDGFFSKHAAQALLAKVYLYMENWQEAEAYATTVIEQAPYTLLSRDAYVGSWAEKYSSESILEVGFTETSNNGVNSLGYLIEQAAYGELLATKDLYDSYADGDIRKMLFEPGDRVGGEADTYFIHKYPRGADTRDDNIKVLRLSEVYLIRAEARAEAGKADAAKNTGAQADLTTIIRRADPEAAEATAVGDELVRQIIDERRKELAVEGNRLFDLNRKKLNLVHRGHEEVTEYEYPNDRFIMPIPYNEINANPNVEQNPGWK